MDYAIIETGGKQYLVSDGKELSVELLPETTGKTITFDKVLLVKRGDDVQIGTPYIDGATIEATVLASGRGKKVSVVRYRAKSRYFKRRGHRQPYTKVRIAA